MRNKKYLIIFIEALFLSAGSGLYAKKLLTPTITQSLRKEGYTTIFESTNPNFEIWENHYSKHKEELLKDNIAIREDISDREGILLFKNWCNTSLKSKSNELFEKARKHCTMDLEIFALQNKGVRLIENVKARNKKNIWSNAFAKHRKEINRLGIFRRNLLNSEKRSLERFKTWCRKRAKELYTPKNYLIATYFSVWCVIDEKDSK